MDMIMTQRVSRPTGAERRWDAECAKSDVGLGQHDVISGSIKN
jgi:hypothetical protein